MHQHCLESSLISYCYENYITVKFVKCEYRVNVFAAVCVVFKVDMGKIAKPVCYQKSAISYLMVNDEK